jgi:hypothetical protein
MYLSHFNQDIILIHYVLPLPPAPAPGPLGLLAPPPLGAAPLGRLITLGPVPGVPLAAAAPWILPNILSAGGFCSAGVVIVVFDSPISPSSGAGRLREVGDVGVVWDNVALTADCQFHEMKGVRTI